MHASGSLFAFSSFIKRPARAAAAWLIASALSACTLITDVDREDIPEPQQPTFPEIDAGPQPDPALPDASAPEEPDASAGPASDAGTTDAGDAGTDAAPGADGG